MLVFGDSFAHYDTADIGAKWDVTGNVQIVVNASLARTNNRCCQMLSGTQGPAKAFTPHYTSLIGQVAVNVNTPNVAQSLTVMEFQIAGVGYNIGIRVNGDGTLSAFRGSGDTAEVELARSTLRPFAWGTWNYIEAQCFFSATVGTVVVRCNGRQVLNLSGIRTVCFASSQFSNAFSLKGAGNGLYYLADCVLIDWSSSPNNTFIDQAKVYVQMPTANVSVQWTPLAGSNFSEVNEIPPDGDTSYNSSSTVGQVDQYSISNSAVPGAASIAALQHCMDMRIDSGARTVASVVGGSVGSAVALTTSYLIYPFPYDTVPSFPVGVGPKVTA